MSVLLSTEVNADNVVINEPKSGKTSGFKSAKIRYNLEGKESRFFLQTGKKMRIPFGISNNEKFGDFCIRKQLVESTNAGSDFHD